MTEVLIVDDSALMRKHLSTLLQDAGLNVRTANNGRDAVAEVLNRQPDVITLDVNMPEMDGLTALSQIMTACPTPVVMISSLTTKGAMSTLEALAMGAVDFVAKPGGTITLSMDTVAADLIDKVKLAARARTRFGRALAGRARNAQPALEARQRQQVPVRIRPASGKDTGLVLVGVSTGGPGTLEEILPALPADLRWPVVVAQHMPAAFTAPLAQRLNRLSGLTIKEAVQFEPLLPGHVYIAKGGTDLAIARRNGQIVALNKPESPQYSWHPSVEVLVTSALDTVAAEQLIAVQLTGMGNDGAAAIADLKARGGRTIAESEDSCVVFGMPKEVIERGGATKVLPATQIARQLSDWLR